MITWKDFQELCEDIKQNPDNYTWVVFDPIKGISFRKGSEDDETVD